MKDYDITSKNVTTKIVTDETLILKDGKSKLTSKIIIRLNIL